MNELKDAIFVYYLKTILAIGKTAEILMRIDLDLFVDSTEAVASYLALYGAADPQLTEALKNQRQMLQIARVLRDAQQKIKPILAQIAAEEKTGPEPEPPANPQNGKAGRLH